LAIEDFETAEQLQEIIEEIERYARSRGWRLKEH